MDVVQSYFPGFLRLTNGRNVLRIFRRPFTFGVHWVTIGERLTRILCEPGNCDYCTNESLPFKERTPQRRFAMWVTVNQGMILKVWEVGTGLFEDVKQVVIREGLNTEDYDIEVWREGLGIETRYKVIRMSDFKYKPERYEEIDNKINMYNMKGLVGDKDLRAKMLLSFEEEQRILDKAW